MSSLVLLIHVATPPAASPVMIAASTAQGSSRGAATMIALIVAIVLVGWSLTVLRQALAPFFEMVRVMAKAAFVAVLTAGAFVALVVALLIR